MTTIAKIPISEDETKFNLPSDYLKILYSMMKNITSYFKQNNIKYFAEGGTLLGIVRNRGQIPYDNDIDLGMLETDFIKLLKCKEDIETKFNYALRYEHYMLKIFYKDISLVLNGEDIFPCVDVFVYRRFNHRIEPIQHWENCYFKESEFKPLIKRKYHDIDVYTPNNPIPYLERYYGGDWRKPVYDYKEYKKT
jgi:lipopolysaccharide cholinephosphotransferase